jgi:23S rRNA pseudouridine2457 synthase
MLHYYIIHKPFQVLSQFTAPENKLCLKDIFVVPADVYGIGRLDYDSEGLLILANDKHLNQKLLSPSNHHEREYWVQVEGSPDLDSLKTLEGGLDINIDGKIHHTKPCRASLFPIVPTIPERNPPIRFRKNIPTTWIRLVLTEGKNRQVRKMTAKIGFPTLRLIRYRIGGIMLDGLKAGEIKTLNKNEIYDALFPDSNNH